MWFETTTPLPGLPSDWLNVLIAGGTTGLIFGLVVLVGLFLTRKIRTGGETEEWHTIATKNTETLGKLVPAVESLTGTVKSLLEIVEDLQRDAELRQALEDERRRGKSP